jgi:hypothetical protein
MALHRDIYWVGRQWAVTGFGVQAVDQRLKGAFDVEAAKVWEDDLPQRMRALAWLNADDFAKALELARGRFPEPPERKKLPLVESVLELMLPAAIEPPKPVPVPIATDLRETKPVKDVSEAIPAAVKPLPVEKPLPAEKPLALELPSELPQPKSQPLAMRMEHVSAKFLPRWRVRHGAP